MLVEMLLLVLIAVAVFGYVLSPLLRTDSEPRTDAEEQVSPTQEPKREPVASDSQPVRDTP